MYTQTARKGVVVLVSYALLEGKPLTWVHTLGACLFVGSVALNMTHGKRRKPKGLSQGPQEASVATTATTATTAINGTKAHPGDQPKLAWSL